MEEVLLEWIDNRRAGSLRVSCKLIMKNTEIVYRDIMQDSNTATEDFKASRGWLCRFLKRNGLSLRRHLWLNKIPKEWLQNLYPT